MEGRSPLSAIVHKADKNLKLHQIRGSIAFALHMELETLYEGARESRSCYYTPARFVMSPISQMNRKPIDKASALLAL